MLDKLKRALGVKSPSAGIPTGPASNSEDLLTWWHSEFTPEEQRYILTKYQPMVLGANTDSEGLSLDRIIRPDGSLGPIGTLAALSTWFMSGEDLPLARRILDKSVERREAENGPVIDRHYIYHNMIRVYYRDRNRDTNSLQLAIEACEKQIDLGPQVVRAWPREEMGAALPRHTGFEQLAIVLERNKDYDGAVRLSEEALRQGWAGDWGKRIDRCRQRSKQ